MKILIDIGHPAHVHYIKNIIHKVRNDGHEVLVCTRDIEIVKTLLKHYDIRYVSRRAASKSLFLKPFSILFTIIELIKIAFKFRPDILFGTMYLAPLSFIIRKPFIAFTDTECAKNQYKAVMPFISAILTPHSFRVKFGEKQISFMGYLKTLYLHPKHFTPDPQVYKYLKIEPGTPYIIFRFVSFGAYHDIGIESLSQDQRRVLVSAFSSIAKVFITSEDELPEDLLKFKINIPPFLMHDALYYSSLFIGQSGTMAAEAALLGTPAVFIQSKNELSEGVILNLAEYNILKIIEFSPKCVEDCINLGTKLMHEGKNDILHQNLLKMRNDMIDVTEFFTWFIEKYPDSYKTMKQNPEHQNIFK